MKRCQRDSFTSSGTAGRPRSLAVAPLTGSYLKQPTRSSFASVEPVEQHLEILLGLAGEADDEGRADGEVRADLAPAADAVERLLLVGRPAHRLQHGRGGVLEGDVEIGQHLALRHQRDDLVDMRVGIDVVQAHPGAELAELAREVEEARAHLAVLPGELGAYLMSTP